ncbi:DUF3596 domain-containing protein, partial [Escherichia coli]|nr:DUF3596 domain-containing protein [Escherichia coli]MCV8160941.1 DUF3596 domain-containing protein [Escherichia coli]MCV8247886.1 DUF3596 domain-containing protein [Escherichia coli]
MREVEMKYPTGVENHGGKLRIWFVYKGVRVRENLGVPDTAKNRRVAGERKRLVRTVLIFTESSDQLSRATDRVPGLPASPG